MTGEYQHSLDNKGRLFIPAKLREELGELFYMTVSMERCLCVYSAASWQGFSDKVSAMPYIRQRRMRPLFAHAARCELDSQGRTIIPEKTVQIHKRSEARRKTGPPRRQCGEHTGEPDSCRESAADEIRGAGEQA